MNPELAYEDIATAIGVLQVLREVLIDDQSSFNTYTQVIIDLDSIQRKALKEQERNDQALVG